MNYLGRFGGNAGCNHYLGRLGPAVGAPSAMGSAFPVGEILDTGSWNCLGPRMEQENSYLANFEGNLVFRVWPEGAALQVTAANRGTAVAEYTVSGAATHPDAPEPTHASSEFIHAAPQLLAPDVPDVQPQTRAAPDDGHAEHLSSQPIPTCGAIGHLLSNLIHLYHLWNLWNLTELHG